MPKFEKMRVSLARDDAPPMLEALGHDDGHRSRRDFLEAAFSEDRAFLHNRTGKRFEFVALPTDGDFVAGIFKRARPVALHDQALRPYDAENYEGAVVVLSISKDQIAWMQANPQVGSNKPLLESFFEHLSKKTSISDWKAYVEYLHEERVYWSVIRERRDEIAKITFTFIPPNALSADDEVYNFVKAVQLEANPDIQQHVYKAEPGKMKPDTEHMNASARIAMAGGGDADVRTADNRVLYSAAQARVTREVPESEMPTLENASFVRRVRDWLFG